jgi:CRP-like cAMP-binding protein
LPDPVLEHLAADSWYRAYGKSVEVDWTTREGTSLAYGVVAGGAQLSFRSLEGRALPIMLVQPGQVFFEVGGAQLMGMDEVVAEVVVVPTLLCTMPLQEFDEAVAGCPETARLLIALQRRWIDVLSGLSADRLHGAESRIRHTLWRDAENEHPVTASYTHEAIAARAGTDRARVTKIVGQLRREGVVEVDREHHIVAIHRECLSSED